MRRQKQASQDLQRLKDAGDGDSTDATMLSVELEAMEHQLTTSREVLATCLDGLNDIESRVKTEISKLGGSKLAVGAVAAVSRMRDLERSLAEANERTNTTFQELQSAFAVTGSLAGPGHDMPVQFSIPFQTIPGQILLVVGTWCDWNAQRGLVLGWTKGNVWRGSMKLHTGSNYEYKYVVVERITGAVPGDEPPYLPSWGQTEPQLAPMFDGGAHMVVWQLGNNKAMALDNIHTDGVARIEVQDEWIANPKKSPITLFSASNEVIEVVGSTALLGETVDRADHALSEARKQVQMMAEVASAALAMVDGQMAKQVSLQMDTIRKMGSLEPSAKGQHHRRIVSESSSTSSTLSLQSGSEGSGDSSVSANKNWMNIGYGLDFADVLSDEQYTDDQAEEDGLTEEEDHIDVRSETASSRSDKPQQDSGGLDIV